MLRVIMLNIVMLNVITVGVLVWFKRAPTLSKMTFFVESI
jgi:hypothetical protein